MAVERFNILLGKRPLGETPQGMERLMPQGLACRLCAHIADIGDSAARKRNHIIGANRHLLPVSSAELEHAGASGKKAVRPLKGDIAPLGVGKFAPRLHRPFRHLAPPRLVAVGKLAVVGKAALANLLVDPLRHVANAIDERLFLAVRQIKPGRIKPLLFIGQETPFDILRQYRLEFLFVDIHHHIRQIHLCAETRRIKRHRFLDLQIVVQHFRRLAVHPGGICDKPHRIISRLAILVCRPRTGKHLIGGVLRLFHFAAVFHPVRRHHLADAPLALKDIDNPLIVAHVAGNLALLTVAPHLAAALHGDSRNAEADRRRERLLNGIEIEPPRLAEAVRPDLPPKFPEYIGEIRLAFLLESIDGLVDFKSHLRGELLKRLFGQRLRGNRAPHFPRSDRYGIGNPLPQARAALVPERLDRASQSERFKFRRGDRAV